jgi:hypothetical protein
VFSVAGDVGSGDANNGGRNARSISMNASHSHSVNITSASDHNHTISSSPTGITIASHGSGTAENIPPVAFGNYVIFTGV